MIIDLSDLYGKRGAFLSINLSEEINDILSFPDVVKFLEPVRIKGMLINEDEIFVFKADGEVLVELKCSRCLASIERKLTFSINERFSRAGDIEEEIETFLGNKIELDDFIKRGIMTVLPMKVLCRDNCMGLCSKCGKDLNEGDCDCDTFEMDPRLEGLKALLSD